MNIIAIIPARAGSKRVPGKNREPVGRVPMWQRAVQCAIDAHIQSVCVITDDEAIAEHAAKIPKVRVLNEPPELAADDVPMRDVLMYAVPRMGQADAVCLLQPTSPLRTCDDVGECIRIMKLTACDSVVSVVAREGHRYERNGAVYLTKFKLALHGVSAEGWTQFYVMPAERSVDVDTAEDLAEARRLAGG